MQEDANDEEEEDDDFVISKEQEDLNDGICIQFLFVP